MQGPLSSVGTLASWPGFTQGTVSIGWHQMNYPDLHSTLTEKCAVNYDLRNTLCIWRILLQKSSKI